MMPFHYQQLQFMEALARARPEWLDPFLLFLNFFDTPPFYYLLIPLIWMGISARWGLRLFYWVVLNSIVNCAVKEWVAWPRPSTEMPSLSPLHLSSFGFPSAGAQGAFFLGALLIYAWRTRAAWIIGLCYILVISLSRIALGVHYPTDVLGGWLIGAALFLLFATIEKPLERFLAKQPTSYRLALCTLIPIAVAYLIPIQKLHPLIGTAIAIGWFSVLFCKKAS